MSDTGGALVDMIVRVTDIETGLSAESIGAVPRREALFKRNQRGYLISTTLVFPAKTPSELGVNRFVQFRCSRK